MELRARHGHRAYFSTNSTTFPVSVDLQGSTNPGPVESCFLGTLLLVKSRRLFWRVFNNAPGFLENLSFTTSSYYRNTLRGSMFIGNGLSDAPTSAWGIGKAALDQVRQERFRVTPKTTMNCRSPSFAGPVAERNHAMFD